MHSSSFRRAICDSIRETAKCARFPEPQVLPATMQELSIKKAIANDMKKNVIDRIELNSLLNILMFFFRVFMMLNYLIIIIYFGKNHK